MGSRLLVIFLLFGGSLSHASFNWAKYCAVRFVDIRSVLPGFFSRGIDAGALAKQLKPNADVLFREAQPVSLTLSDGSSYGVKYGRSSRSLARFLELSKGGKRVSELSFAYDERGQTLHLNEGKTEPEYAGMGAHAALVKTAIELSGKVKYVAAQLAWLNFKKVAEKLDDGADMSDMNTAEKTVERAVSRWRKGPLVSAIEESPTGKVMVALGYRVDTSAFLLKKADKTDGIGPILDVKWVRR